MNYDRRTSRRNELAVQILRHASLEHWKSGTHLRELSLAKAMGVSRTPVRAALQVLEEGGAVQHRKNSGYFLIGTPKEFLSNNQFSPINAEERLYLKLVDARLAGEIGEKINKSVLMTRFNVGRQLIERVLQRLANEGAVEQNFGGIWQFLPTFDDENSWQDSYLFRLALEPICFLLPDFYVNHKQLQQMRSEHLELLKHEDVFSRGTGWIVKLDSDFHLMIAEFSGNSYFITAVQMQNRLKRLSEIRTMDNHPFVPDWCEEHLQIMGALENADLKLASELMREHLLNGSKRVGIAISGT